MGFPQRKITLVPCLLYQPIYSINSLSQKSKNHQIIIPFVDKTWDFAGVHIYLKQVKTWNFIIRCAKSNIVGTPSYIFVKVICRGFLRWEIAAAICRGNLEQLFILRICRRNLRQLIAVRICRGSVLCM